MKLEIPLVFLCTGIYRYSLFCLKYRWYSCVSFIIKRATVNQQLVLPVYIYIYILTVLILNYLLLCAVRMI